MKRANWIPLGQFADLKGENRQAVGRKARREEIIAPNGSNGAEKREFGYWWVHPAASLVYPRWGGQRKGSGKKPKKVVD